MKKLTILTVADSWHHFEAPIREYEKRLSRDAELITLKPEKHGDITSIREKDTKRIVSSIERYTSPYVIACDVTGTPVDTTEVFAAGLNKLLSHEKHIIFVIGGAYGFERSLLDPYVRRYISFTPWTLPHGLATLTLLEQLYRGYNILSGGKYHHGDTL